MTAYAVYGGDVPGVVGGEGTSVGGGYSAGDGGCYVGEAEDTDISEDSALAKDAVSGYADGRASVAADVVAVVS